MIRRRVVRHVEPAAIVGLCCYEAGAICARRWPPLTDLFRSRPATFVAFVGWLVWHTWLKAGAPVRVWLAARGG